MWSYELKPQRLTSYAEVPPSPWTLQDEKCAQGQHCLIISILAEGTQDIPQTGRPLTQAPFVAQLQHVLHQARLPGNLFNGYSFRIWVATTASQIGITKTNIKILGRWNSLAYQTYVHLPFFSTACSGYRYHGMRCQRTLYHPQQDPPTDPTGPHPCN